MNYINTKIIVLVLLVAYFFNVPFVLSNDTQTTAKVKKTPSETVKIFYKEYINLKNKNKNALDKRAKYTLRPFISKGLLQKLDKLSELEYGEDYPEIEFLQSPDFHDSLDADYFLKSQDIFDDWENHIFIKNSEPGNNAAYTVIIALGATAQSRNTLMVHLVREFGAWKIDAVFDKNPQ